MARLVPIDPVPPPAPQEARPPACPGAAEGPCLDPDLLAANRALDEAFRAARRAGVPAGELRAERDDWQGVQAGAASRSRAALLSAYRDRIAELRELAEAALDPGEPEAPREPGR